MLAMAGGFALTLTLLIPAQVHRAQNIAANGFPAWNFLSDQDVSGSWSLNLGAIAPWLGPFWLTGVWLFCLLRLVSWISVQKLRSRGVCGVSEVWRISLLS